MAQCPRCALTVPAFTRCDRCGLMLGYDGLTVLIDFEHSPAFVRVRHLARRQPSYSEWQEENGHRFLRVTYDNSEMEEFRKLAELAAPLPAKRAFFNGLQIPWPATPWRAHFPWMAVATSASPRASHYAGK
jgi:hypothetical protein